MRALAAEARWGEAEQEALGLVRGLGSVHAVARHTAEGLVWAVRARDAEEIEDFAALVEELFAGCGPEPPGAA